MLSSRYEYKKSAARRLATTPCDHLTPLRHSNRTLPVRGVEVGRPDGVSAVVCWSSGELSVLAVLVLHVRRADTTAHCHH